MFRRCLSRIYSMPLRQLQKPSFNVPQHEMSTNIWHPNDRMILSGISLDEFSARRAALASQISEVNFSEKLRVKRHIVVIPSAEVQYMAYHVPYPFLQDSTFLYLTGLQEANSLFVMDVSINRDQCPASSSTNEYLFVDVRSHKEEIWDGPSLGTEGAALATNISNVHPVSQFLEFLRSFIFSKNKDDLCVWYSPLCRRSVPKKPINRLALEMMMSLQQSLDSSGYLQTADPEPLIDRLRLVKSAAELKLLQQAVSITSKMLTETMAFSKPGMLEEDLANFMEYKSRCMGTRLGYPPVVASGHRTNIIHYLDNAAIIDDGDLVLIDAGCRVAGYTSDITRTWPVTGKFSPLQRVLYEILTEVLQSCVAYVSPACSLNDVHQHMLSELTRHLVTDGILEPENAMAKASKLCPHHVGHYLGLDVHDTPTISYGEALKPGVVFPLEPGVYFRENTARLGIHKEFIGLGMRIEDDYFVREDGRADLLSHTLPTDADTVEELIGKERTIAD